MSGNRLTRFLEELQLRGNCVDVSWCSSCRKLTVTCTCSDEDRRTSMFRISDALLDLAMVMRCGPHIDMEPWK